MYLFIEKGLRGGISYVCKRYSKANNKYMKNYDTTKPSKYISDLDMNNLYGWRMSSYLPYDGFKWLKKVYNFDVNSISKNSSIGYIVEDDLEYSEELYKLPIHIHDYPLVPEKLEISYAMLPDVINKLQTNMK